MLKALISLALLALFVHMVILPDSTLARGEEKPGPNGGEIRMPGAFHTELKVSGRQIWVYLLDLKFEKARTDKSSVVVEVVSPTPGAAPVKLDCKPAKVSEPPKFVCMHANYEPSKGQTLKVRANRGTAMGQEVSYVLPLLSGESAPKSVH
ncbi:hypothetical protein BH10BDE1_BH10BDE1_14200 [soil metagenome]